MRKQHGGNSAQDERPGEGAESGRKNHEPGEQSNRRRQAGFAGIVLAEADIDVENCAATDFLENKMIHQRASEKMNK